MSFTLDVNVLLGASDASSAVHERARALVEPVAEGPEIAYLFWPTIMAYLRMATHPAVFARPLTVVEAIGNIEQLLSRPHDRTTGETDTFWRALREVVDDALPSGNLVPDAHVVALMQENDVWTIWARDRDYRRFSRIEVRDPFA